MLVSNFGPYIRYVKYLDSKSINRITIANSDKKLGIKPLPMLWYEDKNGNKYIPTQDEMNEPVHFHHEILKDYPYMNFHDTSLVHRVYDDDGKLIMEGSSSYPDAIVIGLVQHEGFRLSDAIIIAGSLCERCMNILLHHYGAKDGYPKDSPQAAKSNTHCEICQQIDPEYDKKYKLMDSQRNKDDLVEEAFISLAKFLRNEKHREYFDSLDLDQQFSVLSKHCKSFYVKSLFEHRTEVNKELNKILAKKIKYVSTANAYELANIYDKINSFLTTIITAKISKLPELEIFKTNEDTFVNVAEYLGIDRPWNSNNIIRQLKYKMVTNSGFLRYQVLIANNITTLGPNLKNNIKYLNSPIILK